MFDNFIKNLDVLIDDTTEGDISSRLASFVKRAASEKTKHRLEINRLEETLADLRSGKRQESADALKAENNQVAFL